MTALLVGLFTFAIYGMTMCRGIYTGDDGDFETAMATLGISHPTGYPLFTLLGRVALWLLAPLIAEPAARINLMTAAFGASASAIFYRFLAEALPSRTVALLGTLLLAFSPTLWQQSLSCEVYSLTALFLSLCLWLSVRLQKGDQVEHWLALVLGLSLTNNLTMVLFLPSFVAFGLGTRPRLWQQVPRLLPWALLPLLLYLYLPWATHFSYSPVLWGEPGTLKSFWAHISGEQYRGLMFSRPLGSLPLRLWVYLRDYLKPEFGLYFLSLVPVGWFWLWRSGQRARLGLSLYIFSVDVLYATNYAIMDIYVYLIPSYIMVAYWLTGGLCQLGAWLGGRFVGSPEEGKRRQHLLLALAVAIPIAQMSLHYAKTDKSQNHLEQDYVENILRCAPPQSVIVTTSSLGFSLWYYRWVKQERPDITLVDPTLLVGSAAWGRNWYLHVVQRQWSTLPDPHAFRYDDLSQNTYFRAIIHQGLNEKRPVLFVPDTRGDHLVLGGQSSIEERLKAFRRVPWGIVERLYQPGTEPSIAEQNQVQLQLWPKLVTRGVYSDIAFNDPMQIHIAFRYFYANKAAGLLAQQCGDTTRAREHFVNATKLFQDKEITKALNHLQ